MKTGLQPPLSDPFRNRITCPSDWFDSARDTGDGFARATRSYSAYRPSDADEALFVCRRGHHRLQIAAGIDVPTDGEVRRENISITIAAMSADLISIIWNIACCGTAYVADLPAIRQVIAMKTRPTARMILPPARRSVPGRSNSPFPGR